MFDLVAVARSESLSWNRAWGRGSPGAPGGSGQRAGSAPGAGRSRAARVGVLVGRGWGAVTVVLSGVPTAAGNALGVRQGRGEPGWRGAGFGSWRGWGRASQLCSRGSPLRLGTPISCAPGSPRIGIQWAQRRGADHGSGHWDCVEQGTTYSALCWHILGAPPPGGRRKASPLGSRPLPLHPSAEKSPSLRGFPKQPSVRWKSKGQNPESWLAGPALLLALCRPAGPGAPAGMGKGRVHELHPRNLVGCMDFKPWWPPRQQRRGEGILLPFHGRICGCPAAWAFSRGPCAIKVWYFGTE